MNIAITGPLGGGKDTAAEYIATRTSAQHISGGDILRGMLDSLGLEPKKTALGDFGTFLRTHYDKDYVTNKYYELTPEGQSLIASGFRSVVEAESHKARGTFILYIDAPSDIRYARIGERSRKDDDASIEALVKLDAQEHSSTADAAENLNAVKGMADEVLVNNGSLEELYARLDDFIVRHGL